MTTSRAVRAALLVLLAGLLLAGSPSPPRADAQDPSFGVTLTLASQTAWVDPVRDPLLKIAVAVRHEGEETLGDLTLNLTIGPRIVSRTVYEQTLVDGPGDFAIAYRAYPIEGDLAPGETLRSTIELDLSQIVNIDTTDSGVYPARIDIRSEARPLAAINTPIVTIVRDPEVPVLMGWWATLDSPPLLGPDGALTGESAERSVSPGGALAAQVDALLARAATGVPGRDVPIDLAINPSVLDQLTRMTDGYRRDDGTEVPAGEGGAAAAAALIERLRALAAEPAVQVTAMPFAAPQYPAMIAGDLDSDLALQQSLGREVTERVLEVTVSTTTARPPDGALDDTTLELLAAQGVTTLLADADTALRPAQTSGFAPPPNATLVTENGVPMPAALPDPSTQALLDDEGVWSDPVLGAQWVFGELAVIWREQPGVQRGVAVALPSTLPPAAWTPLVTRLGGAPFLKRIQADSLIRRVVPSAGEGTLALPSTAAFSSDYADALRGERRRVSAYRSMLPADSTIAARLERNLLMAEAGRYVLNEDEGRPWIDSVHAVTTAAFDATQPDTSRTFTFTSRDGTIPLLMGDPGPEPLTVRVRLRSSSFRFPDGGVKTVTLNRPDQLVTFAAEAKRNGRGVIEVLVRAPSGPTISQQQLIVRVTAANLLALIVTGAAALGLLALWARRWVRRTKKA
jgi:hypothetical protein